MPPGTREDGGGSSRCTDGAGGAPLLRPRLLDDAGGCEHAAGAAPDVGVDKPATAPATAPRMIAQAIGAKRLSTWYGESETLHNHEARSHMPTDLGRYLFAAMLYGALRF